LPFVAGGARKATRREQVGVVDSTAPNDSPWPDELSDAELTEFALAADPNAPLSPDAVPWSFVPLVESPLPAWYMPPAVALRTSKTARITVAAIILSFLVIDSLGLCVTYGFISLA
jgi:hypothetical protein